MVPGAVIPAACTSAFTPNKSATVIMESLTRPHRICFASDRETRRDSTSCHSGPSTQRVRVTVVKSQPVVLIEDVVGLQISTALWGADDGRLS